MTVQLGINGFFQVYRLVCRRTRQLCIKLKFHVYSVTNSTERSVRIQVLRKGCALWASSIYHVVKWEAYSRPWGAMIL